MGLCTITAEKLKSLFFLSEYHKVKRVPEKNQTNTNIPTQIKEAELDLVIHTTTKLIQNTKAK